MPWIVGIDEAGYGPNLGPFVMSMAAIRVPPQHERGDLWKILSKVVTRRTESKTGKLWVNDSKVVYSPDGGLPRLERHFLPFQWDMEQDDWPLPSYWTESCLTAIEELQAEPWYADGNRLPLHGPGSSLQPSRQRLLRACQSCQVAFARVKSVVIFPQQFNALLAQHGSKAAVPAAALGRLLQYLPIDDSVHVAIDKLGGRDHYHQLLQTIFPDRFIMVRGESERESTYQTNGSEGPCEFTFQPEADRQFFSVALASMASKYLREVLMHQFNRFWQEHMPGVKPTAGYPGDAARFYEDIRPARDRLGIRDELLWRAR